jgi:hypothetical protein
MFLYTLPDPSSLCWLLIGVDYTIDNETFLITEHKESWDIQPLEVSQSWVPCIAQCACFSMSHHITSHHF